MKRVHLPLKLPGISSWELWIKVAKNVSAGMSVLFTHSRKSAVTLLVIPQIFCSVLRGQSLLPELYRGEVSLYIPSILVNPRIGFREVNEMW